MSRNLLRVKTPWRLSGFIVATLAMSGLSLSTLADTHPTRDCPAPGEWHQDGGEALSAAALLSRMAEHSVVLLGEEHDRLAHHRWQLHTLAGLYAHQPKMVIGLEMLPREAQSALDAWVAGELDEAEFLEASDWHRAWGYDADLYLPILHFARMQRVPLRAINVTPDLRRRLVESRWELPKAERFGISPPAEPTLAYRESLEALYARHPRADDDEDEEADLERFIDAQLVWDRAMATALVEANDDATLVVGLMGQGHLANGHGVPHQLDDLGMTDHRSLLPWTPAEECRPPDGLANGYYILGDESRYEPPTSQRLGVMIQTDGDTQEILARFPVEAP